MTQKNRATLKTDAAAAVYSNTDRSVSGNDVQAQILDLADSAYFKSDEPNLASGDLLAANDLSDLADAPTARTNLGLGNVTNTSDADKPVSTAQQTALDGKLNTADIATAAQIRANTADKLLTTPNVYGAMAPVTLTDAATIAVDMATGIAFTVTLGGNRAMGNPTNVPVAKSFVLRVVQDATGNRGLSLPNNVKMADGGAIELSTAANAIDLFSGFCWSATEIYLFPIGKAFS